MSQQVAALAQELRKLEGRLAEARGAAAEGGRSGAELRGQVAALTEQLVRWVFACT